MKKRFVAVAVLLLIGSGATYLYAHSRGSRAMLQLFSETCLAGPPQEVRIWASRNSQSAVPDPSMLQPLMGEVPHHSTVWKVSGRWINSFWVSIDDASSTCAVWGEDITAKTIQRHFGALVDRFTQGGLVSTKIKDENISTTTGGARSVVYNVTQGSSGGGFLFSLLVADRSAPLVPGTQLDTMLRTDLPALQRGDPNANALVRHFGAACVGRVGSPDQVREWAAKSSLPPITNPEMLRSFVGDGGKGAAWELPSPTDKHFALAIRGASEACAVYAEAADPQEVERLFRKLIEGVKRPGLVVLTERDEAVPTKTGSGREITFFITNEEGKRGHIYSLIAADRTGALFGGAPLQAQILAGLVAKP